jgi:subtilisin family serine protease
LAEQATPDSVVSLPSQSPAWQRQQHLARLGILRWHAAGLRGQGVKIAILDSGFRGYQAYLGKALPSHLTVRSFRLDGDLEAKDSQHGILCAEVVHAIAPEAELLLANWEPDRPDLFLEAVRWARKEGARIISCSMIMPSWSDGEGGGPVNEALADIVGSGREPGDVLCFASAGNTAQRHWYGFFHGTIDGYHLWRPGLRNNLVTPWGNTRVSVELYGSPGGCYDLLVYDALTGALIGQSLASQNSRVPSRRTCAVVRFTPLPARLYVVRVRCPQPSEAGLASKFHLVVLGGGLSCSTSTSSISCPADGPAALAVGAVDSEGHRLFYSACGPNSRRPKPDFVAVVPFPSLWRPRPFSGTSAAAPQAAALAALWWSSHPDWCAEQVREVMRKSARDLGPPGHDFETGYGLLTLP